MAGAVEVEDGGEGPRVSVEVELHVIEAVVVTQLHDGVVSVAEAQSTQPRVRQTVQGLPHGLVFDPSHVQNHSARVHLVLKNRLGVRYVVGVHAHILRQLGSLAQDG